MALVNPSFSICIHSPPASVRVDPHNAGAVTVKFEQNASITVFCESAEMAIDLGAAIEAVICKHVSPEHQEAA